MSAELAALLRNHFATVGWAYSVIVADDRGHRVGTVVRAHSDDEARAKAVAVIGRGVAILSTNLDQ